MKVRRMLVKNLPDDIYKKLYRLNMRADGTMQEYLVESRRGSCCPRCGGDYKNYAYFLKKENDILAWAIWFNGTINFWTHGRCRKKGYAKKVAKEIIRHQGRKLRLRDQNYIAAAVLRSAKKEITAHKRKAKKKLGAAT